MRRRLAGILLVLGILTSGLVLFNVAPAFATVTHCGVTEKPVNNSHGRLEVIACTRHTAGNYYSYGYYTCFRSGSVIETQDCNIGADQTLAFNDLTCGCSVS